MTYIERMSVCPLHQHLERAVCVDQKGLYEYTSTTLQTPLRTQPVNVNPLHGPGRAENLAVVVSGRSLDRVVNRRVATRRLDDHLRAVLGLVVLHRVVNPRR